MNLVLKEFLDYFKEKIIDLKAMERYEKYWRGFSFKKQINI